MKRLWEARRPRSPISPIRDKMLLKDKFPITATEFSHSMNGDLDFNTLTVGSRIKVYWKCILKKGHIWSASPNQRTSSGKLRGCPICAGKIVTDSNSLAALNPEIAREWHSEKNTGLSPTELTTGSNRIVWWRCKDNFSHEWQASPKQRTKKNNSCPYCGSLSVKFPEIAKEWHPTKNGELSALDIAYSSHKQVWWKCKNGFDHVWQASPNLRTSMQTGCPICSGHKVVKSNSLAVVFPEVAAQWDYDANNELTPDNIYCKSTRRVYWRCSQSADHVWTSPVKTRANGGGCPFCSGRKTTASNSLKAKFPEIAKLWHPTANTGITPLNVTPYSNRLVWWQCPTIITHKWQAIVANVVNGSSCPICLNRQITSENNLSVLFPDLVKEWDYDKNKNINPTTISTGSKIKVAWKCGRNPSHEWEATITDRCNKNSGCPFCANEMNVSEHRMLELLRNTFKGKEVKYCYRPKWLNRMELDVYIPELRLGFEYQGIQHFKPIDFFGGEKAYLAQAHRDRQKKKICDNHKVTIIYFYYDEALTKSLVMQKLTNAGISAA